MLRNITKNEIFLLNLKSNLPFKKKRTKERERGFNPHLTPITYVLSLENKLNTFIGLAIFRNPKRGRYWRFWQSIAC